MECPNCNFQNVPGLRACVRCQSLLDFSGISIDPPRAAEAAVPMAIRHAATRAGISVRQTWADSLGKARSVFHPDVDWGGLWRSIIPGWGHVHLGHRSFGPIAVCVWLVLVVLTLLTTGGPHGWFMYFTLVGWHGLVISLILARPMSSQPIVTRAFLGLLIYALLNVGLYLPALWAVHGVARPFTLIGISNSDVLHDGDTVMLTGRWNRPEVFRRGDIVVYEIRPVFEGGAFIRGGIGVDRIVAGPGDTVTAAGSLLLVNGVPVNAAARPLRTPPAFRDFGIALAPGEFFIVPSLFSIQGQLTRDFPNVFARACVVREDDISGKVLWRSGPWSRFGRLEQAPRDVHPIEEHRP